MPCVISGVWEMILFYREEKGIKCYILVFTRFVLRATNEPKSQKGRLGKKGKDHEERSTFFELGRQCSERSNDVAVDRARR